MIIILQAWYICQSTYLINLLHITESVAASYATNEGKIGKNS